MSSTSTAELPLAWSFIQTFRPLHPRVVTNGAGFSFADVPRDDSAGPGDDTAVEVEDMK